MKKQVLLFISMLIVLIGLSACSSNNQSAEKQTNLDKVAEQTNTAETDEQDQYATAYPLEITDYTDTKIVLTEEPKRVVTLVPSETEIVFAVGGGDKVVGINAFSDYPPEAQSIQSIGDATINVEAVVATEPDLVLASYSMNGHYIDAIRSLGITVYVSEPKTYDETANHIEMIGLLLNKQAEAAQVANDMRQVRATIEETVVAAEKPKVYLEFSPGWTVGGEEYLDELIQIAGGQNINQATPGWFEVNGEAVIDANPDVIIYPNFGEAESSILKAIEERPGWDVIDAVKNDRIIEVSNEPLVRIGPRLAIGLKEIAEALHPELF